MPTADPRMITCPACHARNRLAGGRMGARCGRCQASLSAPSGPVTLTDASFKQDVLDAPGPVLVDCWAPWCGPCRMLGPVIDQLAEEYAGRLTVGKLNTEEARATAQHLGIMSIPTLLLYRNGQIVARQAGASGPGQLKAWLAQHGVR